MTRNYTPDKTISLLVHDVYTNKSRTTDVSHSHATTTSNTSCSAQVTPTRNRVEERRARRTERTKPTGMEWPTRKLCRDKKLVGRVRYLNAGEMSVHYTVVSGLACSSCDKLGYRRAATLAELFELWSHC